MDSLHCIALAGSYAGGVLSVHEFFHTIALLMIRYILVQTLWNRITQTTRHVLITQMHITYTFQLQNTSFITWIILLNSRYRLLFIR